MEAKEIMMMGEMYCVPTPTRNHEIRNVEGVVMAECEHLEHAALIADGYSAAVDLIRDMDRVQLRQVLDRIRNGTATIQDADYVEKRLAKFCAS